MRFLVLIIGLSVSGAASLAEPTAIIDDFSQQSAPHNGRVTWELVSDRVMGGVSDGTLVREVVQGRTALRLRGRVSLENNGGFLQLARDLNTDGRMVDASGFDGIAIEVLGNGKRYNLHLRTTDLTRPWQSYRQTFSAGPTWKTVRLAFSDFKAHRTDVPLDLRKLRRIGLLAIGEAFDADLAVAALRFYRDNDR